MRWPNFLSYLFLASIYTTFPLAISAFGKVLRRMYGCSYGSCNASYWCSFTEIDCGSDYSLAEFIASLIDTGMWSLLTVPTGLLIITLLVVIQIITLSLKFIRDRDRSSRR